MGTVISIIILLLGIIIHKKRKHWYAPDVLFCYQWALITFLSSLHLYSMFESSAKVYLIVLVGAGFTLSTTQDNNVTQYDKNRPKQRGSREKGPGNTTNRTPYKGAFLTNLTPYKGR